MLATTLGLKACIGKCVLICTGQAVIFIPSFLIVCLIILHLLRCRFFFAYRVLARPKVTIC